MLAPELVAGIRSMRPAVPAKDHAESRRFYETIGFDATVIAPTLVEMRLGPHAFLLQDFYVAEYANNFVMHLFVEDSEAWWAQIAPLALETAFKVRPPRAPKLEPWGLKVLCLFDPSNVLWQIASRL
jgi:hypothetical protein